MLVKGERLRLRWPANRFQLYLTEPIGTGAGNLRWVAWIVSIVCVSFPMLWSARLVRHESFVLSCSIGLDSIYSYVGGHLGSIESVRRSWIPERRTGKLWRFIIKVSRIDDVSIRGGDSLRGVDIPAAPMHKPHPVIPLIGSEPPSPPRRNRNVMLTTPLMLAHNVSLKVWVCPCI